MTRALHCVMVTILILGLIAFSSNINFVHADTNVPSIISSDTTWTQAGSPYVLAGPVRVNSGVTLTLEPGATVNVGTYYLQIDGTLRSIGTSANPVNIKGALSSDISTSIGYINFTDSCNGWSEQTGSGCIIEYTIINQTIIYTGNSTVKINSDTISFQGSMEVDNVVLSLSGQTQVTNNVINGAVLTTGGSPSIYNNKISGGMGLYGGSPTVSNNIISGSSTYFFIGRDENREYNTIAVNAYCSPTMTNNQISGTIGIGDYRGYTGTTTITGNTILGDVGGGGNVIIRGNIISGGGVSTSGATALVQNNLIVTSSGSSQPGVTASDSATVESNTVSGFKIGILVNGPATVKNNNIQNWTQYGLKLASASDIDASNNWWGTTDTQAISQGIYDQKNDFNLGTVTFTPFLTAPNPDAPTLDYSPVPSSSSTPSPLPTATPAPASPTPVQSSNSSQQDHQSQQTQTPLPNNQPVSLTNLVVPIMAVIIIALVVVIAVLIKKINVNRPSSYQSPPTSAEASP
jgi:hypothetical protein